MRDGENRVTEQDYSYLGAWADVVRNWPPGMRMAVRRREELPPLVNPVHRKLYVMGSLRNPEVAKLGHQLREALGWEVFDDWNAASPDADDSWKLYEEARGRTYLEALKGQAAYAVFNFDIKHLNESTHGLLVLPAGRSAHMELGYLRGQGKKVVILLDADYKRWDVMYGFGTVVDNLDDAIKELRG